MDRSILEINPFSSDQFANWERTVTEGGGSVCVGVLDSNGKFHVAGDKEMMSKELNKINTASRRSSMDWVPIDPLPKLPMPLPELFNSENRNKIKKTASAFIHHFLEENQHLGKVG